MKNMKRFLASLLTLSALAATPSWAFQSVKITTITASVTTGGVKTADFTAIIRNVGTPFTGSASAITWSGANPLTTSWKIADQMIVINSTVTDNNGGIRIYSDNTAADATPRYVDPTPLDVNDADSRPNSLLKGTSGVTSEPGLPMAWTIKATTVTVGTTLLPREPNDIFNPSTPANSWFQWLYLTDKTTWDGIDLNNDGDYIDADESQPLPNGAAFTLLRNKKGLHYGQDPQDFGVTPNGSNLYLYFQANFTGADVQQAYQTTALRIEAFVE